MDERAESGVTAAGDVRSDGESATGDGDSAREIGITTVEPWSPKSSDGGSTAVRTYLTGGESLRTVESVRRVDEGRSPAAAALTDERLLLVEEDGGFVGVGLDRICSVRSRVRSTLSVRGRDFRLLTAFGYLLAVVGFLGVLGGAANPLSPTLAIATLGGVLATDHARRTASSADPSVPEFARDGRAGEARDRLERLGRRAETAAGVDLALAATAGLAVGPFVILVAVEDGVFVPFFTLLVVAGAGLAVYAVRHSEDFEGFAFVRRRQRRVTATVEDGTVVTLTTRPDSTLDRRLAALAGTAGGSPRTETTDD